MYHPRFPGRREHFGPMCQVPCMLTGASPRADTHDRAGVRDPARGAFLRPHVERPGGDRHVGRQPARRRLALRRQGVPHEGRGQPQTWPRLPCCKRVIGGSSSLTGSAFIANADLKCWLSRATANLTTLLLHVAGHSGVQRHQRPGAGLPRAPAGAGGPEVHVRGQVAGHCVVGAQLLLQVRRTTECCVQCAASRCSPVGSLPGRFPRRCAMMPDVAVQVWQRREHTVLRRQVGQRNKVLHRNRGEQHDDGTSEHCTILPVKQHSAACALDPHVYNKPDCCRKLSSTCTNTHTGSVKD